jgi:nucleoside-diphosphate-sugar epimerase
MADKKVMIITGALGRIGQAAVRRFKDKYTIVGLDIFERQQEGVEHVVVDISSDESVKKAFTYIKNKYGSKLGPVLHLAAYYSFAKGSFTPYENITIQGTRRILDNLKEFEVEQFHFASTLLVYKPCLPGEKITESWPVEAKWDYPRSKVLTEKVMREHPSNFPKVVMRIAGCYDDECHSIPISNNVQRIYEHQLEGHLYPGNLNHGNPFLHLEDLVDAYELAIAKVNELPHYFLVNIVEDKTIPYGQLQNMISQILEHKDFTVFRIPKWVAKTGAWVENKLPGFDQFIEPWMIDLADDHYEVDISLAKSQLGWTPKHFVGTSLPVMLQLLKTDPVKWYQINGLKISNYLKRHIEEQSTHVASK